MSQNVMSSGNVRILYSTSTGIATKIHTFHDNYNDHIYLNAECNTTSDVGYCLQSFPKDTRDLRRNWINAVKCLRSNSPSLSSLLSSKDFRGRLINRCSIL